MDVLRLNESAWIPDKLVEGYDSMIWTERYEGNGEFKMTTTKVDQFKKLLPEGTWITLRDTREIMMVDTHSIAVDAKGNHILTLSGATIDKFLEERVITTWGRGKEWLTPGSYTTAEICGFFLWQYMINGQGEDPTRGPGVAPDIRTAVGSNTVVLTDSVTKLESRKRRKMVMGYVYPQFLEYLRLGELGFRAIRPLSSGGSPSTGGIQVGFDITSSNRRGFLIRNTRASIPELQLNTYNGVNRTKEQSLVNSVVFHYNSGHIDAPQYLWSFKGWKNVARVTSGIGTVEVFADTKGTRVPRNNPTGFRRRILFVEGGDKPAAEEGQPEMSDADFREILAEKGVVELAKHNRKIVFDGAISPLAPYQYGVGKEYYLGDLVTVEGQYGFTAAMRVSEYVRTEDKTGDRGYPTLVLPDVEEEAA